MKDVKLSLARSARAPVRKELVPSASRGMASDDKPCSIIGCTRPAACMMKSDWERKSVMASFHALVVTFAFVQLYCRSLLFGEEERRGKEAGSAGWMRERGGRKERKGTHALGVSLTCSIIWI